MAGGKPPTILTKITKTIINELKAADNVLDVKYEDNTLFLTYKKGEDNLEKMISYLKKLVKITK